MAAQEKATLQQHQSEYEIQKLEKAALSSTFQSPTGYLLGAVAAFVLLNPVALHVAGMAAFALLYAGIKRAARNGSNAAYVRETGCFAHCLDDRGLIRLIKLVGKEEVAEQVLHALDAGQHLSSAASEFLECSGQRVEPVTMAEAVQTIAVSAETVTAPEESIAHLLEDATSAVAATPADVADITLPEFIANDPKSAFFSAPVRTGKGALVAGCIRATQKAVASGKHPTIKTIRFWVLTPKQFPGEWWYWATADKFHNPNLEDGDRVVAARSIYDFINEYGKLPRDRENPTVLIADEFSRLAKLLKGIKMSAIDPELFAGDNQSFDDWFTDKLLLSASMLQATGYYAWIITPSNTVGGRGFTKGDADSFNVFTLAAPANLAFADGSNAAFAAPATSENHSVFRLGFAAGYRKRDRKWYPVPDFGDVIDRRTDREPPVKLTNWWREPASVAKVEPPVLDDEQPELLRVSAEQLHQYITPSAAPSVVPAVADESEQRSLYDWLSEELRRCNSTLMHDWVRWLQGKIGQPFTRRDAIQLWGMKKNRGISNNDSIQPFIEEAKKLGLLSEEGDRYTPNAL